MKKINYKIVATLSYGRFLSGFLFALIIAALILGIILFLTMSIIALLMVVNIIEYTSDDLPILIGTTIIALCDILIMSYFLYKRSFQRKKIIEWLADAVQLRAHSRAIDIFKMIFHPADVELEVKFIYENIRHVKNSSNLTDILHKKGHDKIFRYFADREINILYSPSFDEVIILKD